MVPGKEALLAEKSLMRMEGIVGWLTINSGAADFLGADGLGVLAVGCEEMGVSNSRR